MADLVRQYKLTERVLFSSFNLHTLIQIHRMLPEIPPGSPHRPRLERNFPPARRMDASISSLHPGLGEAKARLIDSAHNRKRMVFVYTVDQEDMVRLFEAGVDGIFTDDPKHAREVLERMRP